MKTKPTTKRVAVLSAALAASTFGFCTSTHAQGQSNPSNPSNATGTKLDNAIDRTSNAVQSGTGRAGEAVQQGADRAADAAGNMANRMGGALDASTSSDIRNTVATATEAALTKGGLDDLVERFSQADRDRLGKDAALTGDHAKLDGRIDQFQKDWKAKYNQDFSIAANRNTIYNDGFARMMTGDFGDAARTASDRTGAGATGAGATGTGATGTGATGTAGTGMGSAGAGAGNTPATPSNESVRTGGTGAVATETAAAQAAAAQARGTQGGQGSASGMGATASGTAGGGAAGGSATGDTGGATANANATAAGDRSRAQADRAIVNVPASHGLPEVNVPLVREGGTWKIDVPDSLTGVQLGNNVLKQLTAANEMKAQWATDPNDAYRAVTHHVLVAILNADAKAGLNNGAGATGADSTGMGGTGSGTGSTGTGAGTHTGTHDAMPR